jgi:hypothetical protein
MTEAGSPREIHSTFSKFLNSHKLFAVAEKALHQDLKEKVNVGD